MRLGIDLLLDFLWLLIDCRRKLSGEYWFLKLQSRRAKIYVAQIALPCLDIPLS
jgi:hypothetical protein